MLWILQLIITSSMLVAPGSASSLTLTFASGAVVGGNSTTGTITLNAPAPAGGEIVTVTNPPGTTVQAGPSQLGNIQSEGSTKIAIVEGARTVAFRVNTAGVATTTAATFTATSGKDATSASFKINPASVQAVTISPTGVVGGQSVSVQIALDGAAAIGTGTTVQLAASSSSRNGAVGAAGGVSAATVPATEHFPPGSRSISVPVTTSPVATDQSAQITATLNASTASGSFVITAPVILSLSLNPSTVVSGNSATGTVTLNGPAAAQMPILLSSNNATATVPASVTVAVGSSQQTFQLTTSPVASGTTVVIATKRIREAASRTDGTSNTIQVAESVQPSVSATLSLLPAPVIGSFTLRPSKVKGGANVIAEIQLLPNVTSAQTVTLTTDQPTLVQLPATISIAASGVATPFNIATHDVNEKTIVTIKAIAAAQIIPVTLTLDK